MKGIGIGVRLLVQLLASLVRYSDLVSIVEQSGYCRRRLIRHSDVIPHLFLLKNIFGATLSEFYPQIQVVLPHKANCWLAFDYEHQPLVAINICST